MNVYSSFLIHYVKEIKTTKKIRSALEEKILNCTSIVKTKKADRTAAT